MKVYVDIDETICYYEGKRNYPEALPMPENIAKINKLYGNVTHDRFKEYRVHINLFVYGLCVHVY